MTESISMIELFSGVGAQERALRQLGLPYEVKNTCDCDANAVLSYAAMRWDLEKEMETFDFPSQEQMIEELQAKNLGYDFEKGKHTITKRTPIAKLKQYYIADKLSKNLGDISKVERLPRANFVTYSSPCQSFSVAGKLDGAAKTCTKCGHKWDIDFSNPDYNYKCPKCGNASLESTTSGLLQEVQRLLSVAYEENELPEYLMLENVKNLVGKKFIGQFTAWIRWLDSIGYNTYYKVLNAKNYGIPQNRERVFAISIRKDIDTNGFTFPEQIPLTTRLKDILEKSVDEKYYLPDDRIEKSLNSTFVQEKKRIQTTDVCDTLLARDYKDPKCVQVEAEPEVKQLMNIMPTKTRDNPNQGRVYDVDGIAPTLTKMDGGNREPFIVEGQRTLWTDTQKQMITEDGNVKRYINSEVVDAFEVGNCADISFPNGYNKANRVFDGYVPAINGTTTQSSFIVKEPIIYDDYNSRVSSDQDAINTLTCNCGASAERNGVKILEKTVIIEDQFPGSRDARIYENYSPTLRQNCSGLEVASGEVQDQIKWRIRKLTDKECWRLMGFTDEDNDRAATYVSPSARYKQAGNSICTCCLIALFSGLFIEDGHKAEVWTKYKLNFDD